MASTKKKCTMASSSVRHRPRKPKPLTVSYTSCQEFTVNSTHERGSFGQGTRTSMLQPWMLIARRGLHCAPASVVCVVGDSDGARHVRQDNGLAGNQCPKLLCDWRLGSAVEIGKASSPVLPGRRQVQALSSVAAMIQARCWEFASGNVFIAVVAVANVTPGSPCRPSWPQLRRRKLAACCPG
jgi:hypothetical protein